MTFTFLWGDRIISPKYYDSHKDTNIDINRRS